MLEDVGEVVGGGYCRLRMRLKLASGGQWLGIVWAPWRIGETPLFNASLPHPLNSNCQFHSTPPAIFCFALLSDPHIPQRPVRRDPRPVPDAFPDPMSNVRLLLRLPPSLSPSICAGAEMSRCRRWGRGGAQSCNPPFV